MINEIGEEEFEMGYYHCNICNRVTKENTTIGYSKFMSFKDQEEMDEEYAKLEKIVKDGKYNFLEHGIIYYDIVSLDYHLYKHGNEIEVSDNGVNWFKRTLKEFKNGVWICYSHLACGCIGYWSYARPIQEKVEESNKPEPKFKVGDTVKYIGIIPHLTNKIGIIQNIKSEFAGKYIAFTVVLENFGVYVFCSEEGYDPSFLQKIQIDHSYIRRYYCDLWLFEKDIEEIEKDCAKDWFQEFAKQGLFGDNVYKENGEWKIKE